MSDVAETLEAAIEAAYESFSRTALLDIDDAVEAQQTIVGLRTQVRDAEIRFGNFKEDLKSLVHKLREAIEVERRNANAEIERLDNRLEVYRIELQEATNEIERRRRENDFL